eukprot:124121-Amphidinium_carterae.1
MFLPIHDAFGTTFYSFGGGGASTLHKTCQTSEIDRCHFLLMPITCSKQPETSERSYLSLATTFGVNVCLLLRQCVDSITSNLSSLTEAFEIQNNNFDISQIQELISLSIKAIEITQKDQLASTATTLYKRWPACGVLLSCVLGERHGKSTPHSYMGSILGQH